MAIPKRSYWLREVVTETGTSYHISFRDGQGKIQKLCVSYVRYADDFLIGVIGNKEDARQVKSDVGTFIKEHLHLEMSPEKTLITHGSDFAHFLGYLITVSREQNSTRTRMGFTRRTYVGKVKLYVPKEKWLNRLLSYGALKISYDKTHGNKEVWEPVRRPGLIRLDDIEILNQYNAEVRGMYNYYRLANNATMLNSLYYRVVVIRAPLQGLCATL